MADPNTLETVVSDLEIGMFVTGLDRPWAETPFIVQGFHITSQEDIDELERHCKYVYVDVSRGKLGLVRRSSRVMGTAAVQARVQQPVKPAESVQFRPSSGNVTAALFPHRKLKQYEDLSTFHQELGPARAVCGELATAMTGMMAAVAGGAKADLSGIKNSINLLVESVLRNPDACVWVARGMNADAYTFRNSVGAAIWTVALGRRMGLPVADLQRIATGALLFDIGKLKLPRELLQKRERLTQGEFKLVQSHVQLGIEMLKDTGVLNRTVTDMVEYHHERYGGHGYPQGLQGDAIPIFGRIAAIIDCYDAITSRRAYSPAMSPSHAVKKMYAWRNIDFQAELVEEFIQTIGLYPAGTLVELSNAEVGVVMAGYRASRLRPQLLMVLGSEKQVLDEVRELDLKTVTHAADGKPLEIATSLEPGAFGVDLERLGI